MKQPDDERGASTIEVLGAIPAVVLVILVVVQVCAFVWTVTAADQAVRDGARALSLGGSPAQVAAAVERSLPGGLDARSLDVVGERVMLQVDVPRLPVVPAMTITRDASMPRTAR
ncbi:TadE/TadG family type IV pilus assembly protein [Xylanimonas allomyrinae]|uniref:TadE/TadG family type IV pilus assembly protein n=1 Tax=Xylanimonas allomyrinae TaxID=2509459 RepID=UPI0013A5F76B|nr:TadE/TadG family type IV pilus assembly protein [Xylanimonas allomyrinae]